MKKPFKYVQLVGLVILLISIMLACQKDMSESSLSKQTSAQQSAQSAQDNSAMLAATQDAVNLTSGAFANQGITYGRTADDDLDPDCQPTVTSNIKIDRTHLDTLIVSGTITLNFGSGTTCDSTHLRKGSIIDSIMLVVVFKGKTTFHSHETITFENYWRDSTELNGSISVTAATGNPTTVKINGSRIRYNDGTSSSWSGNLVFVSQTDSSGHRVVDVTGSWNGTTRSGTTFSANITKTIVYQAGCFGNGHNYIPVSGTIEVTTNGTTSIIDYGNGTCDRNYTITVSGVTTVHRLT